MSVREPLNFIFFILFICNLKNTAAIVRERPSRFGSNLVRKMKYLSFIAVLFYLSLLFPATSQSAASSWVDLHQANENFSVALVSTASHQTVDSTETSNDNDKSPVCWNSFEFPAAQNGIYQQAPTSANTPSASNYAARAPPVLLS